MPNTDTGLDFSNATVGQPVEGGCCWTNFSANPSYPEDATTAMADPWVSLGELSDNGYTKGHTATNNKFKGWHGSVVLTTISEEEHTYKLEFIETSREAVMKLFYGADNVTAADGVVSHVTGKPMKNVQVPLVIDELESNGYLRRTVVKKASIDSFDDEPHNKGALLVYGMQFTAIEVDGSCFDIYRAKPASA